MLVLFACKDSSPLYKFSKTKNHLKPENLETLFLLSMHIKSITNYQAEINTSKVPNSPLIFRFSTVHWYFNIQMCSYLMLEIKSFFSFKNKSFLFWMRVHFKCVCVCVCVCVYVCVCVCGELSPLKCWGVCSYKLI